MKKNQDQPADADELRRRSEELLKRQGTEAETRRLVHELEVHRIELEMQNEELKTSRAEVEEGLALYTDLYDFAPTGYVTLDREGAIRQVNLTGTRLLGVERSRLVKQRFGSFVAENDRRAFSDFLEKVFASRAKEYCEVMLSQEGSQPLVVRIEGTRSADGQECRAVVLDITNRKQVENELRQSLDWADRSRRAMLGTLEDQKRVEAALRESEERFRFISSLMIDIAYSCSRRPDGNYAFEWISGATEPLLGLTEEELRALGCWGPLVEDEDRACFERKVVGLAPGEGAVCELRLRRKDGSTAWFSSCARCLPADVDPRHPRLYGGLVDVTERKRAEEELRFRNLILSTQQEVSIDGILVVDENGRIISSNRRFAEMWGIPSDITEAESDECALQSVMDKLADPEEFASKAKHLYEVRDETSRDEITLKDGRTFDRYSAPMVGAGGKYYGRVWYFRDITERKRLEKERGKLEARLGQQQRLESIGTLAGGVAHEINNPINGIMNYAQLISDRLDADSPLREFAGEILRETERVADIVRNLLAFARHEKQSHSPARMADIVEATLSLVRTVMRHDQITLTVEVPEDLPKIKCRSQQIQQVVMNLLTNARDALNERYPEYSDNKIMSITARELLKEGRQWIRVTVEDHGTGITPEVQEHMFDPFYSSKSRDLGTGLGLSISHGIVKEHGGEISVESEPGKYTRFHVDLPVKQLQI